MCKAASCLSKGSKAGSIYGDDSSNREVGGDSKRKFPNKIGQLTNKSSWMVEIRFDKHPKSVY